MAAVTRIDIKKRAILLNVLRSMSVRVPRDGPTCPFSTPS
jgi:hypothetical protein